MGTKARKMVANLEYQRKARYQRGLNLDRLERALHSIKNHWHELSRDERARVILFFKELDRDVENGMDSTHIPAIDPSDCKQPGVTQGAFHYIKHNPGCTLREIVFAIGDTIYTRAKNPLALIQATIWKLKQKGIVRQDETGGLHEIVHPKMSFVYVGGKRYITRDDNPIYDAGAATSPPKKEECADRTPDELLQRVQPKSSSEWIP
jgi:hypothetical protein